MHKLLRGAAIALLLLFFAVPGYAAQLSMNVVDNSFSPTNITTLGTLDWQVREVPTVTKSGAALIGTVTVTGPEGAGGQGIHYNWSDGDPTGSTGDSNPGSYVYPGSTGDGWTIPVSIGTTAIKVYVDFGAYQLSSTKITATLSDGSASAVNYTFVGTNGSSPNNARATITAAAGSNGQTLTIKIEAAGGENTPTFSAVAVGESDGGGDPEPGDMITIERDNGYIVSSPGTWANSGPAMVASSPGSYRKLSFSSVDTLKMNVQAISAGSMLLGVSIDGGALATIDMASQTSVTLASGLGGGAHVIETVLLASVDGNRWDTRTNALKVTSYEADADAVIVQASARPKVAYFFGDSNWEGYNSVNNVPFVNTYSNNSLITGPRAIAAVLDAEYGQITFSGQGYENAGLYGVPKFNTAYASVFDGASRLDGDGHFIEMPDYIFLRHGHNDGSLSQANVETAIDNLRAAAPLAKIFVLPSVGGHHKATIEAAVTAKRATDANVYFVDGISPVLASITDDFTSKLYSGDSRHVNALGAVMDTAAVMRAVNAATNDNGTGRRQQRGGFGF